MEKNCLSCKYYNSGVCINKDNKNNIQVESNTEDQVVEFIEEGYLSEAIRENLSLKRLGNDFLSMHIENEYIKKNCISKALNETYEEDEIDIYESIEDVISSILFKYFKGANMIGELYINNPYDFSCSNWE